jgi:hypothetical protein
MKLRKASAAWAVVVLAMTACSNQSERVLVAYSINDMTGILTQSGVAIDKDITSDGEGSLKISATEPVTVRLVETGDLDVENARLLYRARVRTENVEGQAYLEMWCHFPGKGEYFSRALHNPVQGSTEWITQETPFFLKKGENPDNVKLNFVIAGTGTAWVDDVELVEGALQ